VKNKICRMESLSPFDLQGTAGHLSAMAARGWRLDRIGRIFWRYRRAEPAKIHYAVTCPPAAGEDGDLRERLFFLELCTAAGWEAVTDWAELQIYASEKESPTPLETDNTLLLERIHRSMRRTYLRDCWSSGGAMTVLLFFLGCTMLGHPISFFLSSVELLIAAVCPLFILGELWAVGTYYRWYRRSLRLVEEGEALAIAPRYCRILNRLSQLVLFLLLLTLVFTLFSPESSRDSSRLALQLLVYLFFTVLLNLLGQWWDRRGTPLDYRFLSGFLAFTAIILCLDHFAPFSRSGPPEPSSYTWNNREWDTEPQALPLALEDLTGEPWSHVRRRTTTEGRTPFAVKISYSETTAQGDGIEAYLYYSVLDARFDFVYRAMLEETLEDAGFSFRTTTLLIRRCVREDPAPWGAEAVYQRYQDDEPTGEWILCWPGRIVTVYTENQPINDGQRALISARLAPEDWKEDTR